MQMGFVFAEGAGAFRPLKDEVAGPGLFVGRLFVEFAFSFLSRARVYSRRKRLHFKKWGFIPCGALASIELLKKSPLSYRE
jgi:hypothetical protein